MELFHDDALDLLQKFIQQYPESPKIALAHFHLGKIYFRKKDYENAQVNALITYQNTGFKLKLLNALFNGRHCIVNKAMVEGTGLEESITLADIADKSEFLKVVDEKMKTPFTEAEVKEREILMAPFFDRVSAQKLMKTLFETP